MGLSYTDILRAWQDAERVPLFEQGWLWDHMVPLRGDARGAALESWTLLGALAAQTQRLRLGVMVTSNWLRNPADLWNCPARTAEEFRHKSAVLDEHCAAVGRDPAEITRSMQILARPGDPAASRALLLGLIDAGARHLVLAPVPPWPDRPAQWLADEVAGPVAAQLASAS
jgi:luciferase-like monooxygenase